MNCMHYKWHNYECYSYNRLIQRYAQDQCFVKWHALSSGINHCIIVYTKKALKDDIILFLRSFSYKVNLFQT